MKTVQALKKKIVSPKTSFGKPKMTKLKWGIILQLSIFMCREKTTLQRIRLTMLGS